MSEKVFNLYMSARQSMQVIGPKGQRIQFVSGKYFTSDEEEIEFLDTMAKAGRDVHTDPKQLQITESERDPMNALRAKFFKEFIEQQQAQLNPDNDRGASVQGQIKASNSRDSAPVAAGGDATALHDQVAKLVPGATTKK
jgi:hypothetical protein